MIWGFIHCCNQRRVKSQSKKKGRKISRVFLLRISYKVYCSSDSAVTDQLKSSLELPLSREADVANNNTFQSFLHKTVSKVVTIWKPLTFTNTMWHVLKECFTLLILHSPYVISSQVLTRCHFISREEEFVSRFEVTSIMFAKQCLYVYKSVYTQYFIHFMQQGLVSYTAEKIQICVWTLSSLTPVTYQC